MINTEIVGSGVSWVSRHEESGLTVSVHDADALASAATRLLKDPELHRRLADTARQRALREFNHQTMAQRSLEIYNRAAIRGKKIIAREEPTRPALSRWIREVMQTHPLEMEHEMHEA